MTKREPPAGWALVGRAAPVLAVFLLAAVAGGWLLFGAVQLFSGSFHLAPGPRSLPPGAPASGRP